MLRRRVRPEEAAEAVARLSSVVRPLLPGGWVPPPLVDTTAVPTGVACDPTGPVPTGPVPTGRVPTEGVPTEGVPTERAPDEPAEEPAPVPGPPFAGLGQLDLARVRFDPGRRGVLGLVVVAIVAAALAGTVVLRGRPSEVAAPVVERAGSGMPGASAAALPGGEVVVSVGGKVRRPGLIRLPTGSRVDDAVRAAGGATTGVGLLNLARRLVDGEQVLVGVAAAGPVGAGPGSGLLDLNTATAEQLDVLPGIGPVLAARIIEWRTEHGRFASVDQLREVPGIGESKYQQLRSKVTV